MLPDRPCLLYLLRVYRWSAGAESPVPSSWVRVCAVTGTDPCVGCQLTLLALVAKFLIVVLVWVWWRKVSTNLMGTAKPLLAFPVALAVHFNQLWAEVLDLYSRFILQAPVPGDFFAWEPWASVRVDSLVAFWSFFCNKLQEFQLHVLVDLSTCSVTKVW